MVWESVPAAPPLPAGCLLGPCCLEASPSQQLLPSVGKAQYWGAELLRVLFSGQAKPRA